MDSYLKDGSGWKEDKEKEEDTESASEETKETSKEKFKERAVTAGRIWLASPSETETAEKVEREKCMKRVLPSTVVEVIREHFGWTRDWRANVQARTGSQFYGATVMSGILQMIDRIPEELLTMDPTTDAQYTLSLSSFENAIARGIANPNAFLWPMINVPRQLAQEDCLTIIRKALESCPDEAPSKSTRGLPFIRDKDVRQSLLIDLGSAERSLNTDEWKACTVLAGSIIEALLLWALQTHSVAEIATAIAGVDAWKNIRRNAPADNLTDGAWRFHDYVHVAAQLQEIQDPLYSRCVDSKDYRNLIHPAVAERHNTAYDRGTSHITIGTVYALIEKLEQRHAPAP